MNHIQTTYTFLEIKLKGFVILRIIPPNLVFLGLIKDHRLHRALMFFFIPFLPSNSHTRIVGEIFKYAKAWRDVWNSTKIKDVIECRTGCNSSKTILFQEV